MFTIRSHYHLKLYSARKPTLSRTQINPILTIEFFHNSRLIRQIELEKITKKFGDLTRN